MMKKRSEMLSFQETQQEEELEKIKESLKTTESVQTLGGLKMPEYQPL